MPVPDRRRERLLSGVLLQFIDGSLVGVGGVVMARHTFLEA